MTKYRILEKKGEYKCIEGEVYKTVYRCSVVFCDSTCEKHPYCVETPAFGHQIYVPKYIVQEYGHTQNPFDDYHKRELKWFNLKEFSNLEEARKYKRDLELDDGIVIE